VKTTILMMTAAMLITTQPGSTPLASPLGATRAAAQSQDMLVEQVAMRLGGFARGGWPDAQPLSGRPAV
jgi:hypothetical protein